MIAAERVGDDMELNRAMAAVRARVGMSASVAISTVAGRLVVEGRVPTYYHKQLVVNALLRATKLPVDVDSLLVD